MAVGSKKETASFAGSIHINRRIVLAPLAEID